MVDLDGTAATADRIAETPPSLRTPKKRSSGVAPSEAPSPTVTGPITPSDIPKASNGLEGDWARAVGPDDARFTREAAQHHRVERERNAGDAIGCAPHECPSRPKPSIAPSSASTESVSGPGL
jgi:hypothetical protein